MAKVKAKKTAKAVAKKKVAPVREVRTATIGGHEIEVPEAAASVYDRVIEVLRRSAAISSVEIADRISGDWTPAELEGALRHGVEVGAIAASGDEGGPLEDGPVLYSLATTAATAPIDEAAVLDEARAELERVLAREDRPRATRVLLVILSEEERAKLRVVAEEAEHDADEARAKIDTLKRDLKDAGDEHKAAAAKRSRALRVARAGREHRDVECHEVALWARGVALTFRVDTGEVIERRALEGRELQGALYDTGAP